MPKISVIIPCYNQGCYLDDAVGSVLNQTFDDYEIVIVNDGSTDDQTLKILADFKAPKTRIVHTVNQGLSSARNNGIKASDGVYILPLDADDKIGRTYLEEANNILDNNSNVGIVYCLAELFGDKRGRWNLPEYSLKNIMRDNVIFCSALFRRNDWELIGGYNSNMKYGWEDYDFWLSLIERHRNVVQINKVLFFYRVKRKSMLKAITKEQYVHLHVQLFNNHRELFLNNVNCLYEELHESRDAHKRVLLKLDKFIRNPICGVKKVFKIIGLKRMV
jgi:glycosyltransferase involved in cell wall biosynthesis